MINKLVMGGLVAGACHLCAFAASPDPAVRPVGLSIPVLLDERPPPLVPDYAVVRVHFATDRLGQDATSGQFFGVSEVSIPPGHRKGQLESPSLLRFEFAEDPLRHLTVRGTVLLDKQTFLADVAARALGSEQARNFLMIQRTDGSFEAGLKKAAQIGHDVRFDGTLFLLLLPEAQRGEIEEEIREKVYRLFERDAI